MSKLIKWLRPKDSHTIILLTIIYIVGFCGILLDDSNSFIRLTPLNLLVGLLFVLYSQKDWSFALSMMFGMLFFVGFIVEVIGTKTGVIFGDYYYGETLGPKLHGVPIAIGLNWLLLVAGTVSLSSRIESKWLKAIWGASLMVMLDFLIEPIAITKDFWYWNVENGHQFFVAPLENYIAWWIIAFVLHLTFHKFVGNFNNKVAAALFLLQILFFAGLIALDTW